MKTQVESTRTFAPGPARFALTVLLLALSACGRNAYDESLGSDGGTSRPPPGSPPLPLSSSKDLTSFAFLAAQNPALSADVAGAITGTAVALTVPSGTQLTRLIPAIVQDGVSVSPATGVPHDFTNPASYTVTAADGSTKAYLVTVNVALSSAKDITQFSIQGINATIAGTSISLSIPISIDATGLTPTIVDDGASVSPASGVAQNFTSPATYTVTAEDGSTRTFTVTVTVPPPLNLGTAVITDGSAPDVYSWPQTTTISNITVDTTAISADFDKKDGANRWPDECDLPGFTGCPGLQYTIWIFEYVGGQWYGTGTVEMWYGRPDTGVNPAGGTLENQIQNNWIYYSTSMASHVLQPGEKVGIMVTGGDERRKNNTDVRERSDVAMLTMP